jgi:hypothetical protein
MRFLYILVASVAIFGCAPAYVRNPVPIDRLSDAAIPNIPGARYWGDELPANADAMVAEMRAQRQASGVGRHGEFLALSGGADDGAYGAGLLAAWSERGDRPEFTTVTGVSTGALSAPFAFLGPDYDDELRLVYGGIPPSEIFARRGLFDILPNASLATDEPLAAVIEKYVDEGLLQAVAREHLRGRRLFVQTANLDAQRPVIWDLGAIAASGAPNAAAVFRQALLASASLPAIFPPAMIEVEVDGKTFDEMHVDGSVVSVNTILLSWQPALARDAEAFDTVNFYIVRNGRIQPSPESVEYGLPSIGARAILTLTKYLGIIGMFAANYVAEVRNANLNISWIGEDFTHDHPAPFDSEYMRSLYQYGFDRMKRGEAWSRSLPQLTFEE